MELPVRFVYAENGKVCTNGILMQEAKEEVKD